ncbi:hypothetical protein K440DRAFT_152750 [Wilcoxina mikolae CBS 423.85]|nr:hypothetical protein K440DRAFT_152750 [Wilcoxina mikolae CBS 423.85]
MERRCCLLGIVHGGFLHSPVPIWGGEVLIYLCFLTLATPLPPQKKPSKLCPITSRGILNVRPPPFLPFLPH